MESTLDESQVTYRVPAGLITRVNGCYNDGATTYKFNFNAWRIQPGGHNQFFTKAKNEIN